MYRTGPQREHEHRDRLLVPLLALRASKWSCQYLLDHISEHVGEAEIAALVAIRQARMLQAEQVQDRGLQVVRVNRIFADVEAQLVRGAVCHAALEATAARENRKRERVVVAAQIGAVGSAAFAEWRSSELAGPDDDGLIKQ